VENACEGTLVQQPAGLGALVDQLGERRHDLVAERDGCVDAAQGIDADVGDEKPARALKGEPVSGEARRAPDREAVQCRAAEEERVDAGPKIRLVAAVLQVLVPMLLRFHVRYTLRSVCSSVCTPKHLAEAPLCVNALTLHGLHANLQSIVPN